MGTNGNNGYALTSPDGIDWTLTPTSTVIPTSFLAYGNGVYVAVTPVNSAPAPYYTSTDGINWTNQGNLAGVSRGDNIYDMIFDGEKFIVVTSKQESNALLTSTSGITWTKTIPAPLGAKKAVSYCNNRFLTNGEISTNGLSWTSTPVVGGTPVGGEEIICVNNTFYIAAWNIYWTADGINALGSYQGQWSLYGIGFGNNRFVAGGLGPATSSLDPQNRMGVVSTPTNGMDLNSTSWVDTFLAGPGYSFDEIMHFQSISYGNGVFVAVGDFQSILTSPTGVNSWSDTSPNGLETLWKVIFANGIFVTVGDNGLIYTSTNGYVWTPRISGTSDNLYGIAYGNGYFVAVGAKGTVLSSTDGILWAKRPAVTVDDLKGITYGNGTFVAVGTHGTIIQSGLYNLTLSKNGAGTGKVTTNPVGINCNPDNSVCSYFPTTLVNLSAIPDIGGSVFSGWSGTSDCFDGKLTMNDDMGCIATFDFCSSDAAQINASPFVSIWDAYYNASDVNTDTIQITGSNHQETLDFNYVTGKNIILQGGYDCLFQTQGSPTIINGSLTISTGSVVFDRIVIM